MPVPVWQLADEAIAALVDAFPGYREALLAYVGRCGHRPAAAPGEAPLPRASWTRGLARFEAACDALWEQAPEADRRALGQVFSPAEVIDEILDDVGFDGLEPGRILDPACGTGAFLARAARRILGRAGRGMPSPTVASAARRTLVEVVGIEIDPPTAALARLRIALVVAAHLADHDRLDLVGELPAPQVLTADALAIPAPGGDFRWIVGNPPYLEAKRAGEDEKKRWRQRFGARLAGAFDLYVCFLELALEWLTPGGDLGMIVPNKFLVNRYARGLRQRMLELCPPVTLRDLSEREVFVRVGVYPITLHARREAGASASGAGGAERPARPGADLARACTAIGPSLRRQELPLASLASSGAACTWFIPDDPDVGGLLARLLDSELPRLKDLLAIRSTVSFHEVGLRERYVHPPGQASIGPARRLASAALIPGGGVLGTEGDSQVLPYLGGKSWAREKEIAPFSVRWDGHTIRYAQGELAVRGNPLPGLWQFRSPKIIFCQHARRLAAFSDVEGRFVTKDVYPIALAPEGAPRGYTAAFAAILNSRLVSVLYAVLFRGICIGGGYYHYLPAFLDQLPCPEPDSGTLADLEALATRIQDDGSTLAAVRELDDRVEDLYGLSDSERLGVSRAFLRYASNDDPFTAAQQAIAAG